MSSQSFHQEVSIIIKKIHHALDNECISIDISQLDRLKTHARLLLMWNEKMNLTRIRDPQEIASRHFVEGLCAGDLLRRKGLKGPLLDLGSGNGFPGVPMAIAWPEAFPIILVESSEKKGAFLRALLREMGWKTSRVVIRRVETGSDLKDLPCRVFTSRGVVLSRLLEESLPFLEPEGVAVLFGARPPGGSFHSGLDVEEFRSLRGRETGILLVRKN